MLRYLATRVTMYAAIFFRRADESVPTSFFRGRLSSLTRTTLLRANAKELRRVPYCPHSTPVPPSSLRKIDD